MNQPRINYASTLIGPDPKCLYGLEDRLNKDLLTVDFNRKPSEIKHSAFGGGLPVCPTVVLARREIMVILNA